MCVSVYYYKCIRNNIYLPDKVMVIAASVSTLYIAIVKAALRTVVQYSVIALCYVCLCVSSRTAQVFQVLAMRPPYNLSISDCAHDGT